jgi:predicted DNA-binding WGR domain protein
MKTLYRIDPTRRMSRFYRLDVQPDLFGAWCVVREWGRIGRAGRLCVESFNTENTAVAAVNRLSYLKISRGYSQ